MRGHPGLDEKNYWEHMYALSLFISYEAWDEPTVLSGICIGRLFHHIPSIGEGK